MIEQSASPIKQQILAEAAAIPRLSGSWLRVGRTAWLLSALVAVALLLTSLPGYASTFGGELAHISAANQNRLTAVLALLSGLASLASALLSLGLAAIFFYHRFREWVVAALSFYLLLYAIVMSGPLEMWSGYWLGDEMLALGMQGLLLATPSVLLLALFPNGRFVPAWSRWLVPLALIPSIGLFLLPSFDALSQADPLLVTVLAMSLIALLVAGFVAQAIRYHRVASSIERQQVKWVMYGFALWVGYILLSSLPYFYLTNLPADAPVPWWGAVSVLGWFLALNILPLSLALAIARYRLWDIDLLINRTLVYGILTAMIIALYSAVVGGLSILFQTQGNWLVALAATGLIAVLFQPIRDRLQRRVNRLLYGRRDEPFEVLARMGQRLEDALAPEQVLPTLVETVAETLKLPYAAITFQQDARQRMAVSYGKPLTNAWRFPLIYQGSTIGHLLAAPRSTSETFTPAEERLLKDVARQAGTAAHALQLTRDLQDARQQVVASREEERRRLRRDLHDGLGPSLAAQLLKLGSARALLDERPEMTRQLLAEMEQEIERTLSDVRRIVYDLRPPALDQWGVAGALRAYAESCSTGGLIVRVEAPNRLPSLPAAVEVAAYHIGREALTNVVRHAQARHCTLRLWIEEGEYAPLCLTIHDDGGGMAEHVRVGVGLAAMRERAAELGGSCKVVAKEGHGTQVIATLPLGSVGRTHDGYSR